MDLAPRERFSDLEQADRSAPVVVGAVVDRVEPRCVKLSERIENRADLRRFDGRRRVRATVGAERPDDLIERANGVMIDRRAGGR